MIGFWIILSNMKGIFVLMISWKVCASNTVKAVAKLSKASFSSLEAAASIVCAAFGSSLPSLAGERYMSKQDKPSLSNLWNISISSCDNVLVNCACEGPDCPPCGG